MKSTTIVFDPDTGPRLDFSVVSGEKNSLIRNLLVNAGTSRGTDPVDPERGTTLLETSVRAIAVTNEEFRHACNFAASDLLFHARRQPTTGVFVDKLDLVPSSIDPIAARAKIDVQATLSDGTLVGTRASL